MQSVGFEPERARARSHVSLTTAPTSAAKSLRDAESALYYCSITMPRGQLTRFHNTARICMADPHTNFVRQIHIQILYGRFTYKFCMAKSHTKKVHCISTVLPVWCLPRTFMGFVLLPEYRWRFFDGSAREVCNDDLNPLLKSTMFITAIL